MLVILTPIPSAPGYYADILRGNLWSARSRWGGTLRPVTGAVARGYRRVTIFVGDRQVSRKLHRLIAEAAYGPAPEGAQCRHLNGDRLDNRAENLAWGTAQENAADRRLHGNDMPGERNPRAKLRSSDVEQIRMAWATDSVSLADLAKRYGVTKQNISAIVNRQTWRHQS